MLSSLTPFAVERWIADCRAGSIQTNDRRQHGPRREDTIGSMLAALKAFSHKYVFRHLEMTHRDLLERVERYEPTPPVKQGLSAEEIAAEYPHLTLAQVYAALAYYHANADEIEADLADEEAAAIRLEAESRR